MSEQIRHSVCRMCHASCDLLVTTRDGKVTDIIGDKHNPAYHGYTCIKGRESGTVHGLPSRLLHAQKRQDDGSYHAITSDQATREIAERIKQIAAEHGPESIAVYSGTFGGVIPPGAMMSLAFLKALGSPMYWHSLTIDQPGKLTGPQFHGRWLAGPYPNKDWDAMLLIGGNPIVSMGGALSVNPAWQLKNCLNRGMKLVVVDPRRTECARKATIHLQCKPREDVTILAGIIRHILAEGLIDNAFVNAETDGIDRLRAAVEPFTPEFVAHRAGVKIEDFIAAAQIIGEAKKGFSFSGTGPNMAGHTTLLEYLSRSLHSLRGWWMRAGETMHNPGVLIEPPPPIAGAVGPQPVNTGISIRTRGLAETPAGLPTGALIDEILTPGKGQIKALIVLGGNPMVAFPDQLKTFKAMQALDLLVCIDPCMSKTAQLAHYVLPTKLALEVETTSAVTEILGYIIPGMDYQLPYAQITPPVLQTPAGADVLEEWEWLYEVSKHMELEPAIAPFSILDPKRAADMATKLDMRKRPTSQEVWRMVLKGSPIPYDEVCKTPEGKVYWRDVKIQPKPAGWDGRLQFGSDPMLAELKEVLDEFHSENELSIDYPFRMLSMRLRNTDNSSWHSNPRLLTKRRSYNPVYINPDDLEDLGIKEGDLVEVRSPYASVTGVAESYPEVRRGCISISHGWGTNPDEPDEPRKSGCCTSRLVANDVDYERYTGIPRMSAVPVKISLAQ